MIWLIICGVTLAILVLIGFTDIFTGEITVYSVLFTIAVLLVFGSLIAGVLYGLEEMSHR